MPLSTLNVVRAAIYPPLGIARIGNSTEPSTKGYFIGPEVPDAPALPLGEYKDSAGALRRQAARFRIYGYDAAGQVVGELTAAEAKIKWRVHLANKKGAWYKFQLALDIPEAMDPRAPPSGRRNPTVAWADRHNLVIDPGPRSIEGRDTAGRAYEFTGGRFLGLDVPLGEIRTDGEGRLLVLGGVGLSQSEVNQPVQEFANNDGWHDDTSDGPVDARVFIGGREIPVEGGWAVVAPPNYAPALQTVRTVYDLLLDRMFAWGLLPAPTAVSFQKHICPIFRRLSGLQWVNIGFAAWFGAGAPYDWTHLMPRLADASDSNREFRKRIFAFFRNPAFKGRNLGKDLWPPFYGDALDSLAFTPGTDGSLQFPEALASLTPTQLAWLKKWAAGHFVSDLLASQPIALEDAPVSDQPHLLTAGALSYCLADAFHPGCEVTWPIRKRSMFAGPFRLRRHLPGYIEPDYGEVLTPAVAVSPMGPLNGSAPGDLTRWLAVPWQADTASCLSGYSFFNTFPKSLPTFWPARVPNQVLRATDYDILIDRSRTLKDRWSAFLNRPDWFRAFVGSTDIEQMITDFGKLGLVEERPGPTDLPGIPDRVWVETGLGLPDPLTPAGGHGMLAIRPPPSTPQRFTLRKFGWGTSNSDAE